VADDESRHLGWCLQRLGELGHAYGDMPAHNLLWEGAQISAGDLNARFKYILLAFSSRACAFHVHFHLMYVRCCPAAYATQSDIQPSKSRFATSFIETAVLCMTMQACHRTPITGGTRSGCRCKACQKIGEREWWYI